jgi:hypothetical protein
MPYIDPEDRHKLMVRDEEPTTAGELNFVITDLVTGYIVRNGLCYDTLNEVVGVLECAKMELYRRVAAPYEDKKCRLNGDVY